MTVEAPQAVVPEDTGLQLEIPSELATDTQTSLRNTLEPIFGEAGPLCVEARNIVVTDVADKAGMKKAGDIRKAIKRIRNDAEKKRKEIKEDALRTGRAIDDIFRPFRQALEAHESYLELQETYEARIEMERIARVRAERETAITEAGGDPANYNAAAMTDQAFEACITGLKAQAEADRIAAEKAEQERIAREKAEAEERERMRVENDRLKAEAIEREKAAQAERERVEAERKKAEAEARAEREKIQQEAEAARLKAEKERKAAEDKARKEREQAEKAAAAERERIEAEARAEREAREKLEREAKERQEAEDRKRREAEEAKAKADRAPDKEKLLAYAKRMRSAEPITATSEAGKGIAGQVKVRLDALSDWIELEASKL